LAEWSDRWFEYEGHSSPCLQWTGSLTGAGYASFRDERGQNIDAHKWAWEKLYGPVPEGKELDHRCHNADPRCPGGKWCLHRSCVNALDHLEPVTSAENKLRGRARLLLAGRVGGLNVDLGGSVLTKRAHTEGVL
jgi:hypothetical protein